METTRYDELRTLVAANFSETTQRLVDEALAYAAECLEKQVRYDGSPLLDHAAGVAIKKDGLSGWYFGELE